MANRAHVAKLKEGVPAWNTWRKELKKTRPCFNDIDLSGKNLSGADLSHAILSGVNLCRADLSHVDLSEADLRGACLDFANLRGVNLSNADLSRAELIAANFTGANLHGANFSGSDLRSANFANANFCLTILANVDLSSTKGLESVRHDGPSTVGIETIYRSKGKIPEGFLRNCGASEESIRYVPLLEGAVKPIQFYSVFISYSSKDQAFAERLHSDLQSKKVRCWFAPEDLKIGDKFRVKIDESIGEYDKLLLLLSEQSVGSDWVEKEVEAAMEKERQQKRTILFPIRLDDAVMKVGTGWPADVRRSRHMGNFQNWKVHDAYQKAFNRLMRDLKADEKKTA
jgi:hypothetical protein